MASSSAVSSLLLPSVVGFALAVGLLRSGRSASMVQHPCRLALSLMVSVAAVAFYATLRESWKKSCVDDVYTTGVVSDVPAGGTQAVCVVLHHIGFGLQPLVSAFSVLVLVFVLSGYIHGTPSLSKSTLDIHLRSSPSPTTLSPGLPTTSDTTCTRPSARRSLECAVRSAIQRSHVVPVSKLSKLREIRSIVRISNSFKHAFRLRHGKPSYARSADKSVPFISARTHLAIRQACAAASVSVEVSTPVVVSEPVITDDDITLNNTFSVDAFPSPLAESAAELERSRCEVAALKALLQQREVEIETVNASLALAQSDLTSTAQRCDILQASLDTYLSEPLPSVSPSSSFIFAIQDQAAELTELARDATSHDSQANLAFLQLSGDASSLFSSDDLDASFAEERSAHLEFVVEDMIHTHNTAMARIEDAIKERDAAVEELQEIYSCLKEERDAADRLEARLDANIAAQAAHIAELEADIVSAQGDFITAQHLIDLLEQELQNATDRADKSESDARSNEERYKNALEEQNQLKIARESVVADLKDKLTVAQQDASSARAAIATQEAVHTSSITEVQEQLRIVNDKVLAAYNELDTQTKAAQQEISNVKMELAAERSAKITLLDKFTALTSTHDQLVVRYDEVNGQLQTQTQRLESQEKALDEEKALMTIRTGMMKKMMSVTKDFKAKYEASAAQINALQLAVEEAQSTQAAPVPSASISEFKDLLHQLEKERRAKEVQTALCLELKEKAALQAGQLRLGSANLEATHTRMRSYQYHNRTLISDREKHKKELTELTEMVRTLYHGHVWYEHNYGESLPPPPPPFDDMEDVPASPTFVSSPLSRSPSPEPDTPISDSPPSPVLRRERKFKVFDRVELRRAAMANVLASSPYHGEEATW